MSSQSPRKTPRAASIVRKRSLGVVPSSSSAASGSTSSDPDAWLNCPVCYEIIQDAYMTRCGHSFCHECIKRALEIRPNCPLCSCELVSEDGKEQVFPNIMLNELIAKTKRIEKKPRLDNSELTARILQLFEEDKSVNVTDIKQALDLLQSKKLEMEANSRELQLTLLREFLEHSRKKKLQELNRVKGDISLLEQDLSFLDAVETSVNAEWLGQSTLEGTGSTSSAATGSAANATPPIKPTDSTDVGAELGTAAAEGFSAVLSSRRFRMQTHFNCLEECYFTSRQMHRVCATPVVPPNAEFDAMGSSSTTRLCAPRGLERFAESLSKFTRYSQLRSLSTLNYASDLLNGTSIVSSIEFDKDNEYFAIAGVTKKIKMFEYRTVIRNDVDMHYPVNEMVCNSKISCISWSSYHKGMLACSDYEGTVTLWDAYRTQKLKTFQEHEKRCWSVDFNKIDTKLLASGSDDTKVKLWAINQEHSVTSIEAKANVCCVRFNPDSMYHLAMGSADHCVHYYDLRNCKTSLGVFKGHKKAVSYVKFLNSKELVSASTDSQLKLWKTDDPQCLRSFTGHVNEKNFVGLATDGDYIACGSENNSLYIYYKGLSTQIQSWSFKQHQSASRDDSAVPQASSESNEFVSAVCWMTGTPVVVAANSQGTIKLLELV